MNVLSERRLLNSLLVASLVWLLIAAGGVAISRFDSSGSSIIEKLRTLEVYIALSPLPGILHSLCVVTSLKLIMPFRSKLIFVGASGLCSTITSCSIVALGAFMNAALGVKVRSLFIFVCIAGFVGAYCYYFLIKRLLIPNLSRKKALQTALIACASSMAVLLPKPIAITVVPIAWWFAFSYGIVLASKVSVSESSAVRVRRRIKLSNGVQRIQQVRAP